MTDEQFLRETLKSIIVWADLALSEPNLFNKGGVRNLTGPCFDRARLALSDLEAAKKADFND